jgi:hypothetical protein
MKLATKMLPREGLLAGAVTAGLSFGRRVDQHEEDSG